MTKTPLLPRLLPLLSLVLGCVSLSACVIDLDGDLHGHVDGLLDGRCQGDASHIERFSIDEPITAVVVDGGVGDVTVHAQSQPGAEIEASLFGDQPRPRVEVVDGVLYVDVDCSGSSCCGADLDLAIAREAALQVDLGVGDVRVTGVEGTVDVDVGTGDIDVHQLAASTTLHTGTGSIDGQALGCADAWVDVGTGDVSLSYDPSASVDAIAIDVGVGAVDLSLPEATYDLRLSTGVGDVSVFGLDGRAGADRRIEVDVGTGDIDVSAL